jgi:signal peptidase I
MTTRKPWLAALLSLIFPGLGFVYLTRYRAAVLWWLVPNAWLFSGMLLCVLFPRFSAEIVWSRLVLNVALYVIQAALAGLGARSEGRIARFGALVLFAVVAWSLSTAVSWAERTYLIEPFRVPSSSMEPSLRPGDQFCVFKAGSGAKLERGAVVVFLQREQGRNFVQRIIGMPGDTVVMSEGRVAVNGTPLKQDGCGDYTYEEEGHPRLGACIGERLDARTWKTLEDVHRSEGSWTVPEGELFLLGDNRGNSYDSRFSGSAQLSDVVGRVGPIWISFPPGSWMPRLGRIGLTP